MAVQGMNVIAQAVAAQGDGRRAGNCRCRSNPDVVFEGGGTLCRRPAAAEGGRGQPADAVHAQRRRGGTGLLRHRGHRPGGHAPLFGPPNGKVSTADYAIGLHASSLVADGGTLQIGIGSLGDAIAQALIVRDRHGDEYRASCRACAPTA
jgi:hypothetical protein